MNIWIIADTHLGHKEMQEFCGRPENADYLILKRLAACGEGDLLIHLGDVCIGNEDEWNRRFCEAVKCKKILVRGNHDKRSLGWYLKRGWDGVADRFDISIYGFNIAFSHVPLVDNGSFDVNIHGHFHNTKHHALEPEFVNRLTDKHILIFIEHHYRPVTLRSIIKSRT